MKIFIGAAAPVVLMSTIMQALPQVQNILIREVAESDYRPLLELENTSFAGDRLSARRIRHWLTANNCLFLVAASEELVLGYCLVLLHHRRRVARLYSIAVSPQARKLGIGRRLLQAAEQQAAWRGWSCMRLEVAASNHSALALYHKLGYRQFDLRKNYYADKQNALRMEKRIP